ncbi:MAG: response regulator [Chlorobiaceae bacterium]|nr:response regulator [Chlorobiaceae bacterium]
MLDKQNLICHHNRLHAFFDASEDPMFIIDSAGTIVELNSAGQAYASQLGADGIGTNVLDFMDAHPSFREVSRSRKSILQQVLSTRQSHIFTDTDDGRVTQIGAYPIFSNKGEVVELFIILQDRTHQRQEQQAVSELKKLWNVTSESLHIGLWKHNFTSETVYRNAEHADIFGYDPDNESSWSKKTFLEHVVPEDRPRVESLIRSSQQTRSDYHYNCRIRKITGEIRWINVKANYQYDENSKAPYYFGTTQDITEFRELEKLNRQLQEQLQQSQKMELLGQLAGGIAHDFNNVLAAIQGNTELIINVTPETHPIQKNLTSISLAIKRSAEMVKQLLAFARKQPIQPKSIGLDLELERMRLILRKLIRENISLRWQLNCPETIVKLDPANFIQIVTNLCINARDAIDGQGSISLDTSIVTTESCEELQRFASNATGEYIRIRIADTGSGIPDHVRPHIFEPFFTTKGVGQGTGLGLSMVYGSVKQHDGYITCETEPGKGTKFNLFFPVVQESVGTREAPTLEARLAAPDKAGVLVVEDEPEILKIMCITLENAGFNVFSAENAEDAIELARQHAQEITLTVSDIILPGMNGVSMSEELQQLNPTMKFMFVSGYSADTLGKYGKLRDDINFISKPFSIINFLDMVYTILTSA